jgi:tetratricopeptide (TPR) repeat protein
MIAGLALFLDERYDRAIEALEQARDLAPGLNEPVQFLAAAYGLAGRHEQAKHEVEVVLQRVPSANVQFV